MIEVFWDTYKWTCIIIFGPIGIISMIYWNWYFMVKLYNQLKLEGYFG